MSDSEDLSAGDHREVDWDFAEGDIIREQYAQTAPGGVELGKTEYRIKWRLVRPSNGKRCYLVEKEEGGTHLYTASALEGRYEVIGLSQSRGFDGGDAVAE